ncbi:hypothetical protein Pse7367_1074 [Thalassoporum mexicanum PCC 7367]|uniref:hypothetical protein n=1 Tax=Thalassoporum mexicanum TaxID=3457544 RepID=UPI00029FEB0F|nr:hypothetical protein [Pseudanabaena sp. PCC 7367]AFY69371.1 hypothetical protein Pse7367_1074 [Pseudanabaena sp. PCC 7367]
MHTSPRQMVSGKLDWGWTQAIGIISVTAMLTGLLLVMGVAFPLWQSKNSALIMATLAIGFGAIISSGSIAKVLVADCRQNLPASFSPQLLIVTAILWLGLLTMLALDVAQIYLESFWAIVGFGLIGIAIRLAPSRANLILEQEKAAAQHLSIITYSDQSVVISPTSPVQQPRQFSRLMSLILSLVILTTADFPGSNVAVIVTAFFGLAGLYTWQVQLYPDVKLLRFSFSGIWGFASSYTINMHNISRLEIIKLREGELHWLQLAGYNREVTLPWTIMTQPTASQEESELNQTLLDTLHLARHDTNRDILGLASIWIPQSAGMFAGLVLLSVGLISQLFLPRPENAQLETLVILAASCMLSPAIARYGLTWIAPSMPKPDPVSSAIPFKSWEVGAAMVATIAALSSQRDSLLALAITWLCFGVGVCLFTLVRRSPINHQT